MVVSYPKFKKSLNYERDPNEIYSNSFSTVRREAKIERFDLSMQPLGTRIIHTCGMIA